MKQSWTLDQLGGQVARALSRGYEPASSGRVRAVPDRRTIRYYTTLGLVDRPSELRGRTAYYGRRHLLQLVAIKRLQAQGLTLREVQAQLTGLDEGALSEIADLPEQPAELDAVAAGGGAPAEEVRARAAFWAARPPVAAPAAQTPSAQEPPLEALRALGLAEGVSLVLPGGSELKPRDLEAIARAAEPLLSELRRLGVLAEGETLDGGNDPSQGHEGSLLL